MESTTAGDVSFGGEKQAAARRQQSPSEELCNSISHGVGLVAALVATPLLITQAVSRSDTRFVIGASIFSATIIMLYLASACYHALPQGKAKRNFQVIEHSAIFLLIAGTYTPIATGVLRSALGWGLLTVVWCLAIIGVTLKVYAKLSRPVLSTGLYLMMGWLMLIAIRPLYLYYSGSGLFWLVAGGVAYTAGVVFFAADAHVRYGHFIWHLFVMAGTGCHYFAVLTYLS